ncbi:MAG: alpha-L-fucosidase [Lentisphaeria bacterium]|nr:alpha-L-fucosidase [Lentisphaeria bacterium]
MKKSFPPGDPRNWFTSKRYGMFVHWGIYAVGGIHEQERWRYGTPENIYNS